MLDIKPLRYFLAVAETLNFGKAADKLHISQPPLSRQISALERDVGATLLERHARGVRLTPAGERLQADAKAVLQSLERAKTNARAAATGEQGKLFIGFTMAAAFTVVPSYARRFAAQWPAVELKLREVMSDDLATQVLDGRIDAAIMFPVPPRPGMAQCTVFREGMCLALPEKHPQANARNLRLADLADDPFMAAPRESSPALRGAIEAYCHDAGFEPKFRFEVQMQQTILGLVADGAGVAIVPQSMRKVQVQGVKFKKLPPGPQIEQVLAWSDANANPCLNNLIDMAGAMAP